MKTWRVQYPFEDRMGNIYMKSEIFLEFDSLAIDNQVAKLGCAALILPTSGSPPALPPEIQPMTNPLNF